MHRQHDPHHLRRLIAIALVAVLAAACTDGDASPEDASPRPTEPTDPAPAEDAVSDGADDDADDQGSAAAPTVVDVDFEERSANGTVVRVSSFEVTDIAILVDVEIIVAAEQSTVYFNNPINGNEAMIVDDQGNTYALIPPDDNDTLEMSAGERLEGTLSFQGPLHAGARTIQLIFNPTSSPDSTNPLHLMQPHFTFPEVEVAP